MSFSAELRQDSREFVFTFAVLRTTTKRRKNKQILFQFVQKCFFSNDFFLELRCGNVLCYINDFGEMYSSINLWGLRSDLRELQLSYGEREWALSVFDSIW